jgi:hypothetical protein
LSFDIIRGAFLLIILIDHIELPPNLFDLFTGRGRLYASAAEGFFFLSGLLVGMVYRRRLERGMKFIFKRLWWRALELYVISVFLTLLFSFAAVATGHTAIKYGLPATIHWGSMVYQSLILHYSFGWADFLSRFAILTFLAPFGIYLLSKRKWWLLAAGSLTAWHFRGTNFIMAWQLIFGMGMVLGYYWLEMNKYVAKFEHKRKSTLRRALMLTAGISFGFSYLSMYLMSYLQNVAAHLPAWLNHLTWSWNNFDQLIWKYCDKWTLGPGRIGFFLLWFAALYLLVEKHQAAISKYSRDWLLVLGQNSLFVYIAHAFIVFIFKLFIPPHTFIWQNFIIVALSLLTLAGVMAARAAYTGGLGTKPFSDFYLLPMFRRSNAAAGKSD